MLRETRNFLDTYALYEIITGNENYSCFAGQTVYCSMINLAELAYALLKQFPKDKVVRLLYMLEPKIIDIAKNDLIKIAEFKKQNYSKNFSYADCIGYVLAKENDLVFVTGDEAFRGFPNILFIK